MRGRFPGFPICRNQARFWRSGNWRAVLALWMRGQDNLWNAARCLWYARAMTLVASILYLGVLAHSSLFTAGGYPPLFDFGVFWAAASWTVQGYPERAYEVHSLHLILHNVLHMPVPEGGYGWFYPPFVLLLLSPLAWLSPFQGYGVFMLSTLCLYLWTIYQATERLTRGFPAFWWGVAGFSGLWYNLIVGQNGFITAALSAAVLLSLERHPVRCGFFLGLLLLKPQLGLLLPLLLLLRRAWLTLFTAGLTVAVTLAVSWFVLGAASLVAWWHNLDLARVFLERGGDNYLLKIPSVYSFLTLLGAPPMAAYLGQGATALGVVLLVLRLWRSSIDRRLRNAAALLGSLLISPYVLEYDLTSLIFPVIWLLEFGRERGWNPGEREVLALLWLLPYLMTLVEPGIHLQLAPMLLLLQLLLILRRSRSNPFAPGVHALK